MVIALAAYMFFYESFNRAPIYFRFNRGRECVTRSLDGQTFLFARRRREQLAEHFIGHQLIRRAVDEQGGNIALFDLLECARLLEILAVAELREG